VEKAIHVRDAKTVPSSQKDSLCITVIHNRTEVVMTSSQNRNEAAALTSGEEDSSQKPRQHTSPVHPSQKIHTPVREHDKLDHEHRRTVRKAAKIQKQRRSKSSNIQPQRTKKIHLRRYRLRTSDVTIVEQDVLHQAIAGTVVGNFMEWYDFGVYGYLAVTMTSVFTQGIPENLGLLVMLLGFAVSFLVRPLGGTILGPLGDRVGRQKVLFFTMSLMAVSTALIGVLPTSQQIGPWAVLLLYALKMVQGFSTGGEYAGATTYISEFSPDRKRGFYSAWLDMGSYLGSAFGAATVAIATVISTKYWGADAMINGGWRVPYLLTIPLGIIAIALRTRIPETPQFADHMKRQAEESLAADKAAEQVKQAVEASVSHSDAETSIDANDTYSAAKTAMDANTSIEAPSSATPLHASASDHTSANTATAASMTTSKDSPALDKAVNTPLHDTQKKDTPGTLSFVVHHHWQELLIAIAIVAATNTAGYVLTSYMPTYLEEEVGTSTTTAAAATVPVLIIMALCLPLIGKLSDRIGRKPIYATAVVSTLVLMIPAFMLLHTGEFWFIQLALALIAIPIAFYAGVSASTLPALFPTESRFGGMGLSYNFAVSLFGGTTPLVAQALIQLTGNHYMPGIYIMVFAVFAGIAVLLMKESSRSPLPGSMPTVLDKAEAVHLVRTQDENPLIDTTSMPMPLVTVEIPVNENLPQNLPEPSPEQASQELKYYAAEHDEGKASSEDSISSSELPDAHLAALSHTADSLHDKELRETDEIQSDAERQ
jgi:MHS family proline/betaine transporter-like MFS transporter